MLAKIKRRSDRLGKAVRRIFRPPSPPPPEYTDWNGLKALIDLLNHNPNGFEPLKATIENISNCLNRFEAHARTRPEYAKIGSTMDELFTRLADHIANSLPPTITHESLTNLIRGIERPIGPLLAERRESSELQGREVVGRKGTSEVLRAYRQVRATLAFFVMCESTSLWKLEIDQDGTTALEALPHCPQAHYRYAGPDNVPRNGCMHNTRVAILQDLQSWVHYDDDQHVFWLNGTAGTGKTSIAYSLCEYLESSGKPLASFFCSSEHPSCQNVDLIMSSICYQLAQQSRPFRHAVLNILQKGQNIHKRPIAEQFEALIATPLRQAGHTFGTDVVVIVDAINECDNKNGVDGLVRLVVEHAAQLPIKLIITSRPSPSTLRCVLGTKSERGLFELRLQDIHHAVMREDIRTYLTTKLQHLRLSTEKLESLVQKSGLLFIFAAMIVGYLTNEERLDQTTRLRQLVGRPSEQMDDGGDMNMLYSPFLRKIIDDSASGDGKSDEILTVLRAATHANIPALDLITRLLKLESTSLLSSISQSLLPVLRISDAGGRMILLDEPFVKYLVDLPHDDGFCLDAERANALLADACFDCIASVNPSFNICGLKSSYLRDNEVPYIRERMADAISPELLYACSYWGVHLMRASDIGNLLIKLRSFFSQRFLLWAEVLNLERRVLDGVKILDEVHVWLQRVERSDDIQQLVEDASAFLTDIAASPITESTPHIYVSGLQMMRPFGPVLGQYSTRLKRFAIKNDTDAPQGHTRSVQAVAYSHDGEYIVSGSWDHTIRIWDAHSGQPVGQPLTGHTSWVDSVAYSPDGAYIVSCSYDNTIRIWDAHTCQPVGQPLTGHTGYVCSVAYSPDGAYIASGSWDETIRIWDAHTGKPVGQPLTGHTHWVGSVAYSPDGAYLVSGSWDEVIRIWDAHTGKPVGQPLTGHTSYVHSVAYSPDVAYIVSGSADRTIRIWDAHSGKPVGQPLTGHTHWVGSVAYSPDGAYIVSGSYDMTIRIWDAQTGKPVGQPLTGHTSYVHSVAYSPDGAYIVSGSSDNAIRVWFAPTLQEQALLQAPAASTRLTDSNSSSYFNRSSAVAEFVTRNRKSKPTSTIDKVPTKPASHFSSEHLVPPITSTPFDWTLNDDGWVVGPSRERLVWIPSELRSALTPPNTKAIISTEPSLSLDFRNAMLGTEWEQCYEPM